MRVTFEWWQMWTKSTNNHCISEQVVIKCTFFTSLLTSFLSAFRMFCVRVYFTQPLWPTGYIQYAYTVHTHISKFASNQIFSWIFITDHAWFLFSALILSVALFSHRYIFFHFTKFKPTPTRWIISSVVPLIFRKQPNSTILFARSNKNAWNLFCLLKYNTQWNHVHEPATSTTHNIILCIRILWINRKEKMDLKIPYIFCHWATLYWCTANEHPNILLYDAP